MNYNESKEIQINLENNIKANNGFSISANSISIMVNNNLNFGNIIERLKLEPTLRFARESWNGKDQYISLQMPDEHNKMQKPYIYISPVDKQLVPWLASQTDMLANDWYLV